MLPDRRMVVLCRSMSYAVCKIAPIVLVLFALCFYETASHKVAYSKSSPDPILLGSVFNFKDGVRRVLSTHCNTLHNNEPFRCVVVLNCSTPCGFWKNWLENPFDQYARSISTPERSVVIYIHDPFSTKISSASYEDPAMDDPEKNGPGGWLIPHNTNHELSSASQAALAIIEKQMNRPNDGTQPLTIISWMRLDMPNSTYIDYLYVFGYYLELRVRETIQI